MESNAFELRLVGLLGLSSCQPHPAGQMDPPQDVASQIDRGQPGLIDDGVVIQAQQVGEVMLARPVRVREGGREEGGQLLASEHAAALGGAG